MKKKITLILALFAVVGSLLSWAATAVYKPLGHTISTSSVLLAAGPNEYTTNTWATNTAYSAGDLVVSTNGSLYWAQAAGTTTSAVPPVISDGLDLLDEAVPWYRVRRKRKQIIIVNQSTNDVWIAHGYAAETDKGIYLAPNGGAFSSPVGENCPQGRFYGIAGGAGTKLTVQEL